MEITHTGHTLMTILKDLVGQVMTEGMTAQLRFNM
jgi:hypothetical protein